MSDVERCLDLLRQLREAVEARERRAFAWEFPCPICLGKDAHEDSCEDAPRAPVEPPEDDYETIRLIGPKRARDYAIAHLETTYGELRVERVSEQDGPNALGRAHLEGYREALEDMGADALEAQAVEIERLRAAFEAVFPAKDGFTEAFDALVTAGLLVEVPSDEAFREWWGDEPTMWVWRWHPLAGPSTTEETSP